MAYLSPPTILPAMVAALPRLSSEEETPELRSPSDLVALFVHASLTNVGFILHGFNEDSEPDSGYQPNSTRLRPEWNATPGSRTFVYSHKSVGAPITIRVDELGSRLEVRAIAAGGSQVYRFDEAITELVNLSAIPIRIPLTHESQEDDETQTGLLHGAFASTGAPLELARLLSTNIIDRLLPGIERERADFEQAPATQPDHPTMERPGRVPERVPEREPEPAVPIPIPDPGAAPRHPEPVGDFAPPGFEDEFEMNQPPRGTFRGPGPLAGPSPFGIGHDDLHPQNLGPRDPLRPSFGPGAGSGGAGGMHPTIEDPLFGGPAGPGPAHGQPGPQAPPGARWDPLGPPGPRFGGPGGGGGAFGPGSGFGGDIV